MRLVFTIFLLASSLLHAAELPETGPLYIIGAASACDAPPIVTIETRIPNSAALAKLLIEWYLNYNPAFAPAYVDTYAPTTAIPTTGDCVTSVLHLNGAGSFTFYSRVISVEPLNIMSISTEQGQEIALAILLLWAVAWVFRVMIRSINTDKDET